jgi:hypothetical protein
LGKKDSGGKKMKILKSGILYFIIVFGAGFILGPIRLLWVVPVVGTRTAELMELPVMIIIIYYSAIWIIRYLKIPPAFSIRLGMGGIALALLLTAEFTLVLWLRGLSITEYLASRDPVSGTAYYISLAIFAIMPVFAGKR